MYGAVKGRKVESGRVRRTERKRDKGAERGSNRKYLEVPYLEMSATLWGMHAPLRVLPWMMMMMINPITADDDHRTVSREPAFVSRVSLVSNQWQMCVYSAWERTPEFI